MQTAQTGGELHVRYAKQGVMSMSYAQGPAIVIMLSTVSESEERKGHKVGRVAQRRGFGGLDRGRGAP